MYVAQLSAAFKRKTLATPSSRKCAACRQRDSCKFLIASIYARHAATSEHRARVSGVEGLNIEVWRNFAAHFGDKAVFITHGGTAIHEVVV